MGAAAFDELHSFFQGGGFSGRNEQMQVIWHQHKLMQQIVALTSIFEKFSYQNLSNFSDLKGRGALPSPGCYKVGRSRRGAMCQPTHKNLSSGAKAHFAWVEMSDLKVRPPKRLLADSQQEGYHSAAFLALGLMKTSTGP
jgi:hypothetical protein